MKKLNQKGTGSIEAIVTLIAVIVVGGSGVYVFKQNNDHKKAQNTTSNTQTVATKEDKKGNPAPDPTANWTTYTSTTGKYSLKYPKSWVRASSPEYCTEGLLLLGANSDAVGKCASDGFGQMAVASVAGDHRKDYILTKEDYSDLVTEAVTVDGVSGQKQTGTYSGPVGEGGFGPEKGDKMVRYLFYHNGRTYSATYNIYLSWPDVLDDFNTMVTKTLTFN